MLTVRRAPPREPKATQTIEIVEFVDANDINPLFFDTPYYSSHREGESKSYALLREALEKSGGWASRGWCSAPVSTWRRMVRGKALVLEPPSLPARVRPYADLDVPKGAQAVRRARRQMAKQLTTDDGEVEPRAIQGENRDDVMALVRRKSNPPDPHHRRAEEGRIRRCLVATWWISCRC